MRLMADGLVLALAWLLAQGAWLYYAYALEFLGLNTFFEIFLAGVNYFLVNVAIAAHFLLAHSTH